MDSNVKKEPIEELKQLEIKQETMSSQAAGFSSIIEVDAEVTINVSQYGIRILHGTVIHEYLHGRRIYKSEVTPNLRIRVIINGLQQQGHDINEQPITVNTNLTLIFSDLEQFAVLREQIRSYPNNYTIEI